MLKTLALTESPELAAKAVHFLCESRASFALEPEDAQCIVSYMRWVRYPPGAVLLLEGEGARTSYMLLVLEGDVSVDTEASGRPDRVAISVIGPGALIGEMALLDGEPRSASCTAITSVQAAGLSHTGLELLASEHPRVACKLMVYLARHTIGRLRLLSEQLHIYDQLNAALHQEISQLRMSKGP